MRLDAGSGAFQVKPVRVRAKGKTKKKRLPPGIDSSYELAYLRILEDRKYLGHIADFVLKPGSLRLGKGCHYEPDFLVILADGSVEYHEVKGPSRFAEKSLVKVKVAAARFPWFPFLLQMGRSVKHEGKRRIVFETSQIGDSHES